MLPFGREDVCVWGKGRHISSLLTHHLQSPCGGVLYPDNDLSSQNFRAVSRGCLLQPEISTVVSQPGRNALSQDVRRTLPCLASPSVPWKPGVRGRAIGFQQKRNDCQLQPFCANFNTTDMLLFFLPHDALQLHSLELTTSFSPLGPISCPPAHALFPSSLPNILFLCHFLCLKPMSSVPTPNLKMSQLEASY